VRLELFAAVLDDAREDGVSIRTVARALWNEGDAVVDYSPTRSGLDKFVRDLSAFASAVAYLEQRNGRP
jgi:hypothetical protein